MSLTVHRSQSKSPGWQGRPGMGFKEGEGGAAVKGLSESILNMWEADSKQSGDLLKTLQSMGGKTKTILCSDSHAFINFYTGAGDTLGKTVKVTASSTMAR